MSSGAGGNVGDHGSAAGSAIGSKIVRSVKYICGGCGALNTLNQRDVIRCKTCGYRIFYKVRTDRPVQFEAR